MPKTSTPRIDGVPGTGIGSVKRSVVNSVQYEVVFLGSLLSVTSTAAPRSASVTFFVSNVPGFICGMNPCLTDVTSGSGETVNARSAMSQTTVATLKIASSCGNVRFATRKFASGFAETM